MDYEEIKRKVNEQVEEAMGTIANKELKPEDLDRLGKLVDIHKDLKNEEYWEEKEDYYMRIRGYEDNTYGRRGVRGTGPYSRYKGYDEEYGRGRSRDSRGRYKGHDYIDEMYDHYGRYSNANEEHRSGRYGAKDEMLESIDDTMGAVYDLVCVISEDATPEVMNIIRKHIKKMGEL